MTKAVVGTPFDSINFCSCRCSSVHLQQTITQPVSPRVLDLTNSASSEKGWVLDCSVARAFSCWSCPLLDDVRSELPGTEIVFYAQ